jgi:hypothetical protein
MVEVSIRGDALHLEILGWSRLLGFRRGLDIPLKSIKRVSISDPLPRFRFGDIRVLGTSLPGAIAVGTFWMGSPHRWAFLDVRKKATEILSLDLDGYRFGRVVVEVKDAHLAGHLIRAAAGLPSSDK